MFRSRTEAQGSQDADAAAGGDEVQGDPLSIRLHADVIIYMDRPGHQIASSKQRPDQQTAAADAEQIIRRLWGVEYKTVGLGAWMGRFLSGR